MIDPIVSLSFTIYSNPGVYALLLGSGVSRSSRIPTGWEVVLDLLRRVAANYGETEEAEERPIEWYRSKFKEEPEYSALLDQLAKAPAERSNLLRGYFEPSETDKEQGLKVPTPAHKAIAQLVSKGFIRVIVTTNFDRLLETALHEVGVVPQVIATPSAVKGALPLAHSKCTIIKVNGDYIDTRIRNTESELASYPTGLNRLLDQVFDEYGLLICGWSAIWDIALRDAIQRCRSRRFTTYWTHRGALDEIAESIVSARKAVTLAIEGADSFFAELEEKIAALHDVDQRHPLTPKLAVATTKRYLVDRQQFIRLNDFVMNETETEYEHLMDATFSLSAPYSDEELERRVRRYEAIVEVLVNVLLVGCYWGDLTHVPIWRKALQRIITAEQQSNYIVRAWVELQSYPGLVLTYAAGIAAVSVDKYDTLKALMVDTMIHLRSQNRDMPLANFAIPSRLIDREVGQRLRPDRNEFTPVNNRLQDVLRRPFRPLMPDDNEYAESFDRFEYLLALIWADLSGAAAESSPVPPSGCFGWRHRHAEVRIAAVIDQELASKADQWPPLVAGLFENSLERARTAKACVDEGVKLSGWRW